MKKIFKYKYISLILLIYLIAGCTVLDDGNEPYYKYPMNSPAYEYCYTKCMEYKKFPDPYGTYQGLFRRCMNNCDYPR